MCMLPVVLQVAGFILLIKSKLIIKFHIDSQPFVLVSHHPIHTHLRKIWQSSKLFK